MTTKGTSGFALALCAGLLGIGQNGLLVMLPQLVTVTGLSLSVWSGLLMFGSMLFLPASPWWGRLSEVRGCKVVVIISLVGYLLSFLIMTLAVWGMSSGSTGTLTGMAGLILSRTLYGLTVSGMVPAAQTWAMQRAGVENRMAALATISSGLSCGRLAGPPLAALMLNLDPVGPLWLMALAPLIALVLITGQFNDPPLVTTRQPPARFNASLWPYLSLALLLATCISLMQIGLSPVVRELANGSGSVSHHIAGLLCLAATSTLLAQFLVVRPQRMRAQQLLFCAAIMMVTGLVIMISGSLYLLYVGIVITSSGAAMATPAYQLLLNARLSVGKGAGLTATSHTLGYGLSALLVPLISHTCGQIWLLTGALVTAGIFLLLTIGLRCRAKTEIVR